MVATLDMLYAIKTIFKAKVIVFGAKNTQKLLENFDFIDKVEIIDFAARGGNQQVLKQINSFYCDYLIAFHAKSFLVKFLLQTNVKRIIIRLKWLSFLSPRCITINISFIKRFFKDRSERAKFLYYARKINPKLYDEKIKNLCFNTRIKIPTKNQIFIQNFLNSYKLKEKDFIIINPFAVSTPYNLSIQDYIALICKASLMKKVIIPTYEAVHQEFMEQINSLDTLLNKQIFIFKNDEDILNLAALLYYSKCLISPSTGTIHLATNLEIPSIGLYPYKDDEQWPTFNKNYVFIPKPQKELSKQEIDEIIEECLDRLKQMLD
ncbi:glycosyltransferase family 9 protein [Campylobacter sp. RM3125]|uniref:glycosyltransferase family 9 protein n=1 Tax=Campylobacter molothri TaxID=1032242 RepID=UPI00301DB26D|nr:glycosyltransferase family 9 protein [Campylobacter sp. W0065]MBZ7969483.1 glycosyltransferase family 9 protein [Campylobacter sp. RM3125]MBZ7971316.1 glycosyltransferase family 9 protein [Campylobacter sp. RM3124]